MSCFAVLTCGHILLLDTYEEDGETPPRSEYCRGCNAWVGLTGEVIEDGHRP